MDNKNCLNKSIAKLNFKDEIEIDTTLENTTYEEENDSHLSSLYGRNPGLKINS